MSDSAFGIKLRKNAVLLFFRESEVIINFIGAG